MEDTRTKTSEEILAKIKDEAGYDWAGLGFKMLGYLFQGALLALGGAVANEGYRGARRLVSGEDASSAEVYPINQASVR